MNRKISLLFMWLGILFCVCLILSNLTASKLITICGWPLTAGVVVFPVTYILNDAITEVWGYRRARWVILTAFAMNLFAVAVLQISVALPPSEGWGGQAAYASAFAQAPRITAASLISFVIGSLINAKVMQTMKNRSDGRRFGLRAIVSTLLGETADSLLFTVIAFVGRLPWSTLLTIVVVETLLKSAYEVIILPVTTLVVRWLKRRETSEP